MDQTVLGQALARLEPILGTANAIGIVLGTGLGGVAEAVQNPVVIPYSDIPGFPENTVSGHAGRLVAGEIEGRRVVVMQGRAHYYETTNAAAMRVPLEVMRKLGRSPKPLGDLLVRVTGSEANTSISLLASHPMSEERLALMSKEPPGSGPELLSPGEWRALKGICGPR